MDKEGAQIYELDTSGGCQKCEPEEGANQLRREMKSRHIQMISIGSVVGMGLFLSTANSLRESGPLGLLLSYAVMGTS